MPKQIVIAGNQEGLNKRLKPFVLPDGAYPVLTNAYSRRQRIRKKRGHTTKDRLRRLFANTPIGNTAASPWTFSIYAVVTPAIVGEPNAQIQLGSVIITIAGPIVFIDQGNGNLTSTTGGNSGTINYQTGSITLIHTAGAGVATTASFSYFPSFPVMGIIQRELTDLNAEETVAFDTKYAYINTPTGWTELASVAPTTWTGADWQLFWGINYYATLQQTQALWVTNNSDPVRYYQLGTWASLTPLVDGVTTLTAALLIIPFKGRLLLFSTMEGGNVFRNRCRYSQSSLIGTPIAVDAWRSDIPGRGGFVDASTAEAIVSVQQLKDRIIVYFERSTWELVYTGNETLPFYFRQINRDLGSESTFSVIPFDGGILGVGDIGIHACNGVNVVRIDEQIPDQVYEVQNANQGPQRVSGVRDFVEEVVYWTYPNESDYAAPVATADQKFPNRVLMYNYVDNTWSDLIESFTCYGYFQRAADLTWATLPYLTWAEWDVVWGGGQTQSRVLEVLAGNQQGYTFLLDYSAGNAKSRSIWSFPAPSQIQSFNHNMVVDDYFTIAGAVGVTIAFANTSFTTFKVLSIIDANNFTFDGVATGSYLGSGEITVLSNFEISSKEFNEFFPIAQRCRFPYVDFLFDRTPAGEVSVYFYINDNQGAANPPLMGTSAMPTTANVALQPIQATQDTIWYRKCVNAVGQFIQYEIRMSTDKDDPVISQMRNNLVAQSDFALNAVVLSADPSGRLAP